MDFLIGAFVGTSIGEIIFSRTILLMAVWVVVPWIASATALSHIHTPAADYVANVNCGCGSARFHIGTARVR